MKTNNIAFRLSTVGDRRNNSRPLLGQYLAPLLIVLLVLSMVGCGRNRSGSYEVKGTVSLDGKPVPAGEVQFEPDPEKYNIGPQSRAKIKDGKYITPSGKGAPTGPALVKILCHDGKPVPGGSPIGSRLARPYHTKIDLPQEDSTTNFDVPASHILPRRDPIAPILPGRTQN